MINNCYQKILNNFLFATFKSFMLCNVTCFNVALSDVSIRDAVRFKRLKTSSNLFLNPDAKATAKALELSDKDKKRERYFYYAYFTFHKNMKM